MTSSVYLIEAKQMLVDYLHRNELDEDDSNSVEYLIDCIDYLLSSKVKITNENLEVIINDILVTGSYLKDSIFLRIAGKITDALEEECQLP